MQPKITKLARIHQTLSALSDDLTSDWRNYPCLIWDGAAISAGYGMITHKQKNYTVHRIAYEFVFGQLEPKMDCCHKCDVKLCYRPIHLFQGTRADNVRDMINKGRGGDMRHMARRGEQHNQAKLTEQQVLSIRSLRQSGVAYKDLRNSFSVSASAIDAIVSRKTWKHI